MSCCDRSSVDRALRILKAESRNFLPRHVAHTVTVRTLVDEFFTMIRHTTVSRLDGIILMASVDGGEADADLNNVKTKVQLVTRRLNRNAEPQASIESGAYTYHYIISGELVFLCICDRSYPRKLAFTYLSDLDKEFTQIYTPDKYLAPNLRPYAFSSFDNYIQQTKATYQDSRATQNLDKLNDELKDVTKVMTKNIEDLLYRGDSLERMGDISSRLREDSRKYKKAAVRINWELLLKQYGPIGGLAFIIIVFIWWRFF